MFLAQTHAESIWQRDYIELHLSRFGLLRNPNKGVWEPAQKLVHLRQFNPRRFASLGAKLGACTIDRFATAENALLPHYNARWRDPRCEAVDAMRLSDAEWRCGRNWCNPPWNLIGELVSKPESSGGKKAADPTKATPADSLAETPAGPTETTRDTTTLALLQALALTVDALSTRLDEQDNNKHKEQRDIPSDDDEVCEGGKEQEHDARTAVATGGARGATAVFIDPRDWEDLFPRAYGKTAPPFGRHTPEPLAAT
eukprot:jgi/Tetstr1/425203/TSEL_015664.t1